MGRLNKLITLLAFINSRNKIVKTGLFLRSLLSDLVSSSIFLFLFLVLLSAFGHQGTGEDTPWSKQENGRATVGSVRPVHTVRPALVARSPAEGRDVQEQAQTGSRARVHGSTGENVVGLFGRGTRKPWRLRSSPLRRFGIRGECPPRT